MKPPGSGLLFVGRFLITDSISLLVTDPSIFSISSRFRLGRLYVSRICPFLLGCVICRGIIVHSSLLWLGFPCWLSGKESACNAAEASLIARSGRSPGEGNSNSLQAPLSTEFPRQEYWSGLSFPPPKDLYRRPRD